MRVEFGPLAWQQFIRISGRDPKLLARFFEIVNNVRRSPFRGSGKPEPLKHEFAGYWSRRLTQEDRIIYRVYGKGEEQRLLIVQCSEHYRD